MRKTASAHDTARPPACSNASLPPSHTPPLPPQLPPPRPPSILPPSLPPPDGPVTPPAPPPAASPPALPLANILPTATADTSTTRPDPHKFSNVSAALQPRIISRRCSFRPPWTGHGRKRPKMAGTLDARGAGGRGGSAPSPCATCPRASLAYAVAGAVFRAHARGVVSPPPWTGHGRKRPKMARFTHLLSYDVTIYYI